MLLGKAGGTIFRWLADVKFCTAEPGGNAVLGPLKDRCYDGDQKGLSGVLSDGKSRRLVALACVLCAPAAFADDSDVVPNLMPAVPVGSVEVRELPDIAPDGHSLVPSLNLSLPVGAVTADPRHRKGKHTAVRSAAAPFTGSLVLNQGPATLDLKVPANDLSSGAVLNLNLPDGAVKAQATASIGKEDGQTAFWHKDAAGVEAQLAGPLGTAVSVSGENRLALTYRAPESVGASDQAAHLVRTQSQVAHGRLSVPVAPFQVTVGADSTTDRTQQGAPGDSSSFVQSAVRTDDHTAFVSVDWHPLADLKLQGGTEARVVGISWQDAHASTYRAVNPNVTATLTPFADTTVTAKLQHTVAPYDAAAFAGYANADNQPNASGFEPDHAWQLETRVEQRVGPANVTATYTAARQGTVTEFAQVAGVQAPATATLKGRDSVAVAVQVPLAVVGLPSTDLSSEAHWQTSRVVDPVTFETRAASGETQQKISLKLAHRLPADNLSIGVTGEFAGQRTAYQVNELSSTAPSGSLGAFLSYKPGAYEVDFNVSGLYGGETRDDFYQGLRGSSKLSHSLLQDNSGPSLRLSLKKPF
jgi:hypothetical protein